MEFTSPSKKIIDTIKKKESFRSKVYDDRDGKTLSKKDIEEGNYKGFPTIGYGIKLSKKEIKEGKIKGHDIFKGISKDTANDLMKKHPVLKDTKKQIDSKQDKLRLTGEQRDAIYSFGYNAGPSAVKRKLDLLKKDKEKTIQMWDKTYITSEGKRMGGLVKRRKDEQEMIRQGEQRKLEAAGAFSFGSVNIDNINVDEISLEDIENELKRK